MMTKLNTRKKLYRRSNSRSSSNVLREVNLPHLAGRHAPQLIVAGRTGIAVASLHPRQYTTLVMRPLAGRRDECRALAAGADAGWLVGERLLDLSDVRLHVTDVRAHLLAQRAAAAHRVDARPPP